MENADQELLELIAKNIVDNPSAVQIDRKIDEMGVLLTLKVDQADMGHVVGRQGMTAKAIRTILRVVGAKHHARVNLKIEEPEDSIKGGTRIVDQVVEDLKL
ncbi:MAG: KH domain-containing protein [Candidatus Parcubacteria bacterium]|nr:KH domain-containing protein [Candidatus Parcubacteria bacterium]